VLDGRAHWRTWQIRFNGCAQRLSGWRRGLFPNCVVVSLVLVVFRSGASEIEACTAIRHVLPVLQMTSCYPIIDPMAEPSLQCAVFVLTSPLRGIGRAKT